jgi:acylphosphatase
MQPTARHVVVTGLVQGVAFRWRTRVRAEELGLAGWVRNLMDGSVELTCEGEPGAVDELLAWLRRGPPAARVEGLGVREVPAAGAADFEIRPSAASAEPGG